MLTVYNAAMSRSTRVLWLLEELGAEYDLDSIIIARPDGSGGPDARNPHPLKQVPCIEHDGEVLVESLAIWLHLCDLYPQSGLAPPVGDPRRARYMSWMGHASAVLEPLVTATLSGAAFSDRQRDARFGLDARIAGALARGPWLMGDGFSAPDLVFTSLLRFFPAALSETAATQEWIARAAARPALARARAKDGATSSGIS